MRYRILFATVTLLASAGAPLAATNLAIMGGALFPVSDFAKTVDLSPYLGARVEFQDVNARGQTAVISYLAWGGFALLLPDADVEAALKAAGQDEDGTYFDAGIGVRVYTRSALFLGGGVSYVNVNEAGPSNSLHGVGFMVGLGVAFNRESFKFEIEGRGNLGLLEDNNDVQHVQLLAAIGFPF
jgi:hypothetical protein